MKGSKIRGEKKEFYLYFSRLCSLFQFKSSFYPTIFQGVQLVDNLGVAAIK